MEPLVPVTVTLKVPSAENIVNIDVAEVELEDKVTLIGLRVAVPLPNGAVAEIPMAPENPYEPAIVRVELAEEPAVAVKDIGLDEML